MCCLLSVATDAAQPVCWGGDEQSELPTLQLSLQAAGEALQAGLETPQTAPSTQLLSLIPALVVESRAQHAVSLAQQLWLSAHQAACRLMQAWQRCLIQTGKCARLLVNKICCCAGRQCRTGPATTGNEASRC